MVVKTNPFIKIDKEYAKVYGELVTRLGQFERIMLNLVKRCDQKISKKTLVQIYTEYGPDTLGTFEKALDKGIIKGGSITIPKEYSKLKKRVGRFVKYRNEIIHSYYSKSSKGIFIRYIERGAGKKPKGTRKVTSQKKFIQQAKKNIQEILKLSKKLDSLQR